MGGEEMTHPYLLPLVWELEELDDPEEIEALRDQIDMEETYLSLRYA
jgi:hypothetical protein